MKNTHAFTGQHGCSCAAAHPDVRSDCRCEGVERKTGSVKLSQKRILIDGTPRLVLAGEIHYFRLAPELWENRLQRLQDSGLDTVATYIPWLWHELPDGTVDLIGTTHPQRNLVAFLELCASRGLHVIARPGPFVMAELKNEGIPYRLYKEPFVQPTTWDGKPVTTRTLDYLAPDFLAAAKGWYDQVMPVLAQYLKPHGGPIIAVQLDNEIGMLCWVSNCPDLTDVVCEDMRLWARTHYGPAKASSIIGADSMDTAAWAAKLRSPGDASLPLHQALGFYMRDRFRRYVAILRHYAEQNGVVDVPYLVNIAGTGGGRGTSFPVCISQLFESYRDQDQMTAGTDFYLGSLSMTNVADLVLANEFMEATLGPDQPGTSLEFEASNGNYGDDLGVIYDPECVELKARMCAAQGNRALNFYLYTGGENPPFPSAGDGIDRLAFTGQRHGFAAPVSPEGEVHADYFAIGRVVSALRAVEDLLADSRKENDGAAIGFVPDQFMTEYHYPGSAQRAAQVADLQRYRGSGPRDVLARAMVLGGFSFPAVNLQLGVPDVPVLVLPTGRTLGRGVQQTLVDYLRTGGKLLLVGLLPDTDHDGEACTLLADALGLKSAGRVEDAVGPNGQYWPSVSAQDWAAPRPEVRASTVQLLDSTSGKALSPLLTEIASGKPCAVDMECGDGRFIFLGCDYPADIGLYQGLLSSLGVKARWRVIADQPGVIAMSTMSSGGQRLLHLLNVAPYPVSFTLRHQGLLFLGGKKLRIEARGGLMLPLDIKLRDAVLTTSTGEIVRRSENSITVRPTQDKDVVRFKTRREVTCRLGEVTRSGERVVVRMTRAKRGKPVRIDLH